MSYSIGEFSDLVGIPSSTLRFYEKEGLITPKRDNNQLRSYSEDDLTWLKFLLHLKSAGFSINELRQYTVWRTAGDSTISMRLSFLKEKQKHLEKEIHELQQSLDTINHKIDIYQEKLVHLNESEKDKSSNYLK